MNIESQTLNMPSLVSESKQAASATTQKATQSDESKSFKSELDSIKGTDQKAEKEMSTSISQNSSQSQDAKSSSGAGLKSQIVNGQNAAQSADGKSFKGELDAANGKKLTPSEAAKAALSKSDKDAQNILGLTNPNQMNLMQPLSELESKIASINELKSGIKSGHSKSHSLDKDSLDATLDGKVIKMDSADAMFFVNLVHGVNSHDQNSPTGNFDVSVMKTEAANGAAKVSATLMDALSDSMKTNKPFRIDFDKDIAVILKVDKEGKVSAEFIPGDKAVEQYLKNNIPQLKERFGEQNLSYGDLTYQKHKQQDQKEDNKRKENKENDDE